MLTDNPDPAHTWETMWRRSRRSAQRFSLHVAQPAHIRTSTALLTLLLLCLPFTVGAIGAFPLWDDGWFWLLLHEHGTHSIMPALQDRPVWAALLALLARSEPVLLGVNFAAQALLWPTLGILAALLWQRLFPQVRRFAAVVACITIAPFATKVQMLTVQFAMGPLLSVVLAYAALLLVLRFVAAADRRGNLALAIGCLLLAIAVLVTEYAVPVVIVALLLLGWRLWLTDDPIEQHRGRIATVAWVVVASAAYGVFLLLTDRSDRPDVHPLYVLTQSRLLLGMPVRLSASLWYGVVGGVAAAVHQIDLRSVPGILGVGYGLLLATVLVYSCQGRAGLPTPARRCLRHELLPLVVVLIAGLVPVAMMGRVWSGGTESRFGVPVLPIVAMVLVLGTLVLVRPRAWLVPLGLFGLVAGQVAFTDAWAVLHERTMLASVGQTLQSAVVSDEQYTVAVLALPERPLGVPRPWELTARLTADWPADQRHQFWAYAATDHRVLPSFGRRTACTYPQEIHFRIKIGPRLDRLVHRKGPITKLLWVEPQPDGTLVIENYCMGSARSLLTDSVPSAPVNKHASSGRGRE